MATQLHEVMNPEVYAVKPTETAETVRRDLTRLGISGAPVVDDSARVLGVVSLKDVSTQSPTAPVSAVMSAPALVVPPDLPIPLAARLMTEARVHRLIVVDDDRVVGVAGALDLLRAQLGLPKSHPETFPHYDAKTGTVWTDDFALDWEHVEAAPAEPGVVLVIRGGKDVHETVVWGESSDDLRATIGAYLAAPTGSLDFASYWRDRGSLRFRVAAIADENERARVLAAVCA